MLSATVSGNITADAILRDVNGTPCISFTIASSRRYVTASGETREQVQYIRCSLWGSPNALPLFFKGRGIVAEGPLTCKVYEDRPQINLRIATFNVFGKGKPAPETAAAATASAEPVTAETFAAAELATAEEEEKHLPF